MDLLIRFVRSMLIGCDVRCGKMGVLLLTLFVNVKMGNLRILHTSNSFLVRSSMPFAASINMTQLSAAAKVRYVSSEKS